MRGIQTKWMECADVLDELVFSVIDRMFCTCVNQREGVQFSHVTHHSFMFCSLISYPAKFSFFYLNLTWCPLTPVGFAFNYTFARYTFITFTDVISLNEITVWHFHSLLVTETERFLESLHLFVAFENICTLFTFIFMFALLFVSLMLTQDVFLCSM